VLYLDGPEDIMVKRLVGRGRSDDNEETIKKRLRVNKRDAQPVVEYYDKLNKVKKIRCDNTPEGISLSRV
jgi:adenylate kinase family enzyme